MRILIADDNEHVRRGVKNILAAVTEWEVCGEAIDGTEAIQSATQSHPDLVLLDISMPGMNGLEAARLIRDKVPAVKILVMSQHDPTVLLPRALQAGAHGCIDKSCLATELVPTLERILAV